MIRINKKLALVFLVLSLLPLITGCSPVRSRIESEIIKSVRERFAPADQWKCRIYGKFSDWIRGRVERVELTGKNVRYDGTRYEELNIVVPNIVYSVSSKRITECDNGFFKASLTEKEINRIAAENAKKGESLEIELREGSLEAVAVKKVLGVSVKARAEGTLSIKNGSSVWFDPKKIDIPGIKVSLKGWTKDAVSGSINPVYTLDTAKNGLYLSKVACKKGRLRVEGNIKSEVLLRNQ